MAQELIAASIDYIDPADCGSTVGYKLLTSTTYSSGKSLPSFYGEIDLTDCSRKICWQFNNNEHALEKINHAITMLTNFKKEFVKAQKKYPNKEKDE
jgi:hypothetical protein